MLCLHFGSNTICSEVSHLSFIACFITVSYFFSILVLFYSVVYCEYLACGSMCLILIEYILHSGFSIPDLCLASFVFSFYYLPGISTVTKYKFVCRHFALLSIPLFYQFGFEFILILDRPI